MLTFSRIMLIERKVLNHKNLSCYPKEIQTNNSTLTQVTVNIYLSFT